MNTEEKILNRISELIELKPAEDDHGTAGEIYLATVAIASQIYGPDSNAVKAIYQIRQSIDESKYMENYKPTVLAEQCIGALKTIANDIRDGRTKNLRFEYQGEVFADFINTAKTALSEGSKDVAAVLACASLEDVLKRIGVGNGLNVEDKVLSEVINALKTAGLLSAQQGALVKGMVPLRNKALHADWEKVDSESVNSVIAFIDQLLITTYHA